MISVADYQQLPAAPADHRLAYGPDPSQFADLYLPSRPGPAPSGRHRVVILIHGGCWRAQFGLAPLGQLCLALVREGIAVWSLEYRRLGNGGGWPATFIDVATAADFLRGVADRFALDLSRVVAAGHSAGGHLALWLAGRHHVPVDSPISLPLPLPLRGVLSLAGIADLAAGVRRNLCGGACGELVGGSPETVPERYQQASPSALLPLGVPQWHIVGRQDPIVPAQYVEQYVALAAAQDDVHLDIVPDAGHFELVVPGSSAWTTVRRAILALLEWCRA